MLLRQITVQNLELNHVIPCNYCIKAVTSLIDPIQKVKLVILKQPIVFIIQVCNTCRYCYKTGYISNCDIRMEIYIDIIIS